MKFYGFLFWLIIFGNEKNIFSLKNKISSEMSKNEISHHESFVQRMTPWADSKI